MPMDASVPARIDASSGADAAVGSGGASPGTGGATSDLDGGVGPDGGSFATEGANWPTLGYDMQRTGVNIQEHGVPPLTKAWAKSVSTSALNPVVVEGARVVVSGSPRFQDTGPIFALQVEDGKELWSYDFGAVESIGQATLLGGRVYVEHQKGVESPPQANLFCLDAASGKVVWASPISSQWEHYWAPAVSGDSVYVDGGTYGGLYGFDRSSGRQKFFFNMLEQYDEWAPTIADTGILTMTAGNLRTHDPASGTVKSTIAMTWTWEGWSMHTLVPVRDGIAYAIAPPSLYAYELTTKLLKWQSTSTYSSYPAVSDSQVFTVDHGMLTALSRATGKLQWTFPADDSLSYPPIAAAGYVYAASAEHVYAVSAATGVEAWRTDNGGWLSIGAGRLFVARPDGVLSVFRLSAPP